MRTEPYLFVVLEGARLDAGGLRVALGGVRSLQIRRGEVRALIPTDGDGAQALEVPDPQMSGAHARVERNNAEFVLVDTGSTNGTLVNGEPIARQVLRNGDLIEVGQTVLLYREIEDVADRAHSLDSSTAAALLPGIVTLDPILARRLKRLARVAASPLPLLLLGETGTGKEVLARGLHAASQRPGPFVAVNCGAIPQNLLESQLFGHVRGAFSGALKDEPGLVRASHHGTLLLDEIGDLPLSSQAALLRVLQESEVMPVGSTHATVVDVRVIAATHKPLDELIESGAFRSDLYARLAGYTFELAPLRDRRVDLGLLIAALLSAGKLGPRRGLVMQADAARALVRYDWPMNVRELEQCLHAAHLLAEDRVITPDDLPPSISSPPGGSGTADHDAPATDPVQAASISPEAAELRGRIVALLAEHDGNLSAVARSLRTSRSQLHRLMARCGITAGSPPR
jgi:transcriptional regulator with GAF, ATPase, and Fis domain